MRRSPSPSASRTPVVATGGGPLLTWAQYLDAARDRIPRPLRTALVIATTSSAAFPFNGSLLDRSGVNLFTAAAACLAALCEAKGDLDARDLVAGDDTEVQAANDLVAMAARIGDARLRRANARTPTGRDEVHAQLFADLCCQRGVQHDPMTEWVLANYLLGWSPGDRAFRSAPALDAATHAAYGTDAASAATALALIVSHGVEHPCIDAEASVANLPDRAVGEALRAVLRAIACPVARVRHVLYEELRDIGGLAARVVAFWHRYPAVHLGGRHYLTAPARILPSALGMRRLFTILERAREIEGAPDSAASHWVGHRFQDFLSFALVAAAERATVLGDHEFRTDGNHRSPDFVILDRGDNVVTLVEAKLRSLTASTFYGIASDTLFEDLTQRFATALLQVLRYLRSCDEAHQRGRLTAEGARAWTEIATARHVVLFVVAPSLPAPVVGARLRSAVWDAVLRALSTDVVLRHFWDAFTRAHSVSWLVGDAQDVCMLAGWRTKRRIGRTLVRYAHETRHEPTFSRGGALHGVLDFVARRWPADSLELPAPVADMMREFWDFTARTAFGRGLLDESGPET